MTGGLFIAVVRLYLFVHIIIALFGKIVPHAQTY